MTNGDLEVNKIITKKNEIIVGPRENLGKKQIKLANINLLVSKSEFDEKIYVKVRSTGKLLDAKVDLRDKEIADVNLKKPEYGISPGQACVFYKKDSVGFKVLGGGWIRD